MSNLNFSNDYYAQLEAEAAMEFELHKKRKKQRDRDARSQDARFIDRISTPKLSHAELKRMRSQEVSIFDRTDMGSFS